MTTLKLKNGCKESVLTYITLGATAGCVQDVEKIICSGGKKIIKDSDLMGHFELEGEEVLEMAAPDGEGFNGNLSFATPPLNCPTEQFPMGVNLAEFIINNGFQAGGQETVDISAVCGVNAIVKFTLSTNDWSTNGGTIVVQEFKNSILGENVNVIGVFPYGCDDCTASVNPPACIGIQPVASDLPICTVQRPSDSNLGGDVVITFLGLLEIA